MKNQNQNPEVVVLDKSLNRTDYINNQEGEYRAIVKVQAGWMTVVDDLGLQANWGKKQWNSARDVFRNFKKGALQTEEIPHGVLNYACIKHYAAVRLRKLSKYLTYLYC